MRLNRAGQSRSKSGHLHADHFLFSVDGTVNAVIGSVKAPKELEIWDDLQRSKVAKVPKEDIRAQNLAGRG